MKKIILIILCLFPVMLYSQQVEIEVVPDISDEMQETEFAYQEMQFNDSFSSLPVGSYLGYLLDSDFDKMLNDACKWKGCGKPFFKSSQNALVQEFLDWLSEHYAEWAEENL